MLVQIHDELLFEAPARGAGAPGDLVREEMVGAMTLSVPIVVEAGWGDNWSEAH